MRVGFIKPLWKRSFGARMKDYFTRVVKRVLSHIMDVEVWVFFIQRKPCTTVFIAG